MLCFSCGTKTTGVRESLLRPLRRGCENCRFRFPQRLSLPTANSRHSFCRVCLAWREGSSSARKASKDPVCSPMRALSAILSQFAGLRSGCQNTCRRGAPTSRLWTNWRSHVWWIFACSGTALLRFLVLARSNGHFGFSTNRCAWEAPLFIPITRTSHLHEYQSSCLKCGKTSVEFRDAKGITIRRAYLPAGRRKRD